VVVGKLDPQLVDEICSKNVIPRPYNGFVIQQLKDRVTWRLNIVAAEQIIVFTCQRKSSIEQVVFALIEVESRRPVMYGSGQ
jgi:hypothetical protein